MATRGILYAVFVLPVIFSIVFGSAVMADILQEPDRELNMWRIGSVSSHDKSIQIIGLAQQYSTSSPVKVLVSVDDHSYDCGDLYLTIYSGNNVVTQSGFLEQCFVKDNSQLPIDDEFSEILDTPGQYELVAEIKDKSQKHTISASGKFTVK
ncbi:hypothetical protein NsoK4_01270 [Nitrosopumilus sp. K4]|uniref:hypothetical protein n=1 Tax=Nitrosopumilus sp. K4 TaxID=2795383 RepID=UPI001BADA2A0|nr:hypothetical protein [Nitrosopumilus sp. K4]QUC64942.1 hypothetical protein NsoK4_01270 [Nitrosopumilus sp. K4]